jgi:hypothetical protein
LHCPVEQISLQPHEQRCQHVQAEREHQQGRQPVEVDALAGDQVQPLNQGGVRHVSLGAQLRDNSRLGGSDRKVLADHPGEDHVRGPAE